MLFSVSIVGLMNLIVIFSPPIVSQGTEPCFGEFAVEKKEQEKEED